MIKANALCWCALFGLSALYPAPVAAVSGGGEFMPWAPATAGLPSVATSADKIYVHGIKPSVGVEESYGAPLSAIFVSTVRKSPWAKNREVLSGDEVKLGAPNVAAFIDNCATGPCVVEIARSLGCGVAVSATVSKVGSTFLVDALAVETANGQVVARETARVKGSNEAALLDAGGLPRIIKKLLTSIPEIKQTEIAVAAKPLEPAPKPEVKPEVKPDTKAEPSKPEPVAESTPPPAPSSVSATPAPAPAEPTPPPAAPAVAATAASGATEEPAPSAEPPTVAPNPPLEDRTGGTGQIISTVGFVGVGVGALGFAIGGISHLVALSAADELQKQPHMENQVRELISQGQLWQTTAFVLYGIGAAVALAGAAAAGGGACMQ
ncbi:MAG: hypothetical protein JXR83_22525 [Deltaproteobacteria bacterium]|nr:hypothetical protein [Deltaproteobacteria bacterium]